jgi:hypothetical protein
MRMKVLGLALGAVAFLFSATGQAHAAPIYLTPTTDGVIAGDFGAGNCEPGCVETVFGLPAGSLDGGLLYKADVVGPESGSYAESYSTAFFNEPDDPMDATISWIPTMPAISCPSCYLAIKDGNQVPSYYFYNLGIAQGANPVWDGISQIIMTGFWPNQGAISHVSIWGAPTGTPGGGTGGQIPEPASLLLLAGGIGAAAFTARRRRHASR